ncbi:hypothetical protein GCM10010345_71780 [Streptomyces canarius]|uniref:Uncharacterized protein n=1 Tax=Streptomyces canarius TaxID=285453 RepID=A0ABQ3D7L5_9ACTN|nr:hypothetical protein GCM10010345_71780 [Streptomyces canarius]
MLRCRGLGPYAALVPACRQEREEDFRDPYAPVARWLDQSRIHHLGVRRRHLLFPLRHLLADGCHLALTGHLDTLAPIPHALASSLR